ncbi:MAG TPA: LuxR C-terminal-related transcriptional regulator [Edaphobacter sp.]|jgi:LuxR family maltose regulon positive regulatory protein
MLTSKQPYLLSTKILLLRSVAGLIDRPRLLGLIAEIQAKQLTVIKAGAGFGKTSLALAWAKQLQQRGNSVTWLSLDSDDDEPTRFLFYVSHALRHACKSVGDAAISLILETSLVHPQTIVSMLINDLTDVDNDVYLFLDDYHSVTDPAIHHAVSFLLKHAPSHFHLVLTTRFEPPLSLAGLLAINQLLEIDPSALRFDLSETRQFIEHEKPGSLDASEVTILHAKTEGWPAVLRIVAAIASQSGQDLGPYVRNLSAALRPIGAYLAEMLDGLPQDMVRFMLRTAILDRLSATLCQAVTGVGASQDLLEALEAHQLLLTPVDQEGGWYRYHPLVAEHLRQRLEAQFGDEIPSLHRRAYRWYASHELWTEAVQHAIAADDTDQAISWIENCAMSLVKTGDLLTLLGWQRLFPTELMRGQVKVRLAIAWGMALAMRFEEALQLVAEIEQDVAKEDLRKAEALRCECQTIGATAVALKDDSRTALSLAEACLERSADPWTANVASNVARFGHWKAGNLKGFYATPWIPFSLDEVKWNVFASVYRLCLQGLVEFQQLRLGVAERCFFDAMRQAEEYVGANSVAAALPASLISELHYEQGRIDEAETAIIDRIPLINAAGMLECALRAYIVLARISAARMNIDRAHALLEQAESLGYSRQWGRLIAAVLVERQRLCLVEGRVTEGSAYLDRLERLSVDYPAPARCAWTDIQRYTALARAQLASAENRFQDAIVILRTQHQEAEVVHNNYYALSLAMQLSAALLKANEPAEASRVFRRVLSAAAPAGICRTILDQELAVGTLLSSFQKDAPRSGQSPELLTYVQGLAGRWRELRIPEPATGPTSTFAAVLSPRELGILERIGHGQSNKEIARDLAIAPETVKSHVKNIFAKLAVERRAQAVSRAQSLGLVRTN